VHAEKASTERENPETIVSGNEVKDSLRKLQQVFAFRDEVPSLTGIDRRLVIAAEAMARVVSGFEARDVKRIFVERVEARRASDARLHARRTFDARKRNFDIRDVNRNIDTRRAIKQSFGFNFDSPDVKFSVNARDVRQNFERRDEAALKRVRQHFESRDVYCQYRQV